MEFHLYIPGKPHPKERPRVSKSGHFYTPKKTVDAEKAIAAAYEAAGGPTWDGPLGVYLSFDPGGTLIEIHDGGWFSAKVKADVDNLAKTVLDGLQNAGAFNDKQIVHLEASKA